MNAYYKETEKPFELLLVDNKPNTPPDKQVLTGLFGECNVYHFAVNSTDHVEPTSVETKSTGKCTVQHQSQKPSLQKKAYTSHYLVGCPD